MASEVLPMSDLAPPGIDSICLALLVDPHPKHAIKALRVALVVLAAGGHIVIDAATGGESFVRVKQAPGAGTPEHLVAVYRVLRDSARSGRLSRAVAQTALVTAFGSGFRRYALDHVAPLLVANGMLNIEATRVLWVFPSQYVRRTPAGDAIAKGLQQHLTELDTLPKLIDDDAARALKLARAAGPLMLLSPGARQAIPRLQALALASPSSAAYTFIEEPEAEWLQLLEHAEELMSVDFDGLLDIIEAIAGFGGDGGSGSGSDGDGGGGDGGGGGD